MSKEWVKDCGPAWWPADGSTDKLITKVGDKFHLQVWDATGVDTETHFATLAEAMAAGSVA